LKNLKFIACIGAINLASSIGIPANGDVVTEWNDEALEAIRRGNTAPPIASRSLAILHVSIYDAVNGIARTHEPYLLQSAVSASASREAAASAAAHGALVNLFPARIAFFDARHAAILAGIPDGPQKTAGIVWGEFVANQILGARANDGSNAIVPPPGGSGPGVWVPTPPDFLPYALPQWGFVAPFAMTSSSQFRPPGPPSLDSEQHAADYDEVKELGAAVGSTRTEEQTEIALFWADGADTETPPGHWNSIAQVIAAAQGNTLEEDARLFALLNIAMADVAICAWDAKYTFHFWRPVTAIAFAEPELHWMSFIITPPFPDYVSGHSTFSGAAATRAPILLRHGRPALHNRHRLRSSARRDPQLFNLPRCSGGSGSEPGVRGHSLPIGKRTWPASRHQHRRMDRYPLPAAKESLAKITAESTNSSRDAGRERSIGGNRIVQIRPG
jgi:hypothetical protein